MSIESLLFNTMTGGRRPAAVFSDIPTRANPGALADLHQRLLSHGGADEQAAAAVELHLRLVASASVGAFPGISEALARVEQNLQVWENHQQRRNRS